MGFPSRPSLREKVSMHSRANEIPRLDSPRFRYPVAEVSSRNHSDAWSPQVRQLSEKSSELPELPDLSKPFPSGAFPAPRLWPPLLPEMASSPILPTPSRNCPSPWLVFGPSLLWEVPSARVPGFLECLGCLGFVATPGFLGFGRIRGYWGFPGCLESLTCLEWLGEIGVSSVPGVVGVSGVLHVPGVPGLIGVPGVRPDVNNASGDKAEGMAVPWVCKSPFAQKDPRARIRAS